MVAIGTVCSMLQLPLMCAEEIQLLLQTISKQFFLKEGNKNIKQLHKEALLPLLLLKLVDMTTETPVSTSNAVQQHKDLQLLSKDSNIR